MTRHSSRHLDHGGRARGAAACAAPIRLAALLLLVSAAVPVVALTPEQIIARMEENQVHDSARSRGSMSISDRFGTRVKTFRAVSRGEERMLLEFTNPEEAGQKILRVDDEIYLYFPEAEQIIHLQGSALKDSVMGSDFSYEDMTGGKSLLDDYSVELAGREQVDGHECYRLELTARRRDVVYPGQTIWVDTGLFVYRRVLLYSVKGRELKEMRIREFERIGEKTVPVLLEMQDRMKKDSKTVFRVEKIEIGVHLDPGLFTLENLSW